MNVPYVITRLGENVKGVVYGELGVLYPEGEGSVYIVREVEAPNGMHLM